MYYHYTSIAALFNIITSERVWFGSLAFMNDEKEGFDLHAVLDEVLSVKHGPGNYEKSLEIIEQFTDVLLRHQLAFCASTLKDDISQWRGYTSIGQGVCIEFVDGFISDPEAKKVECIYDAAAKRQAIIHNENLKASDAFLAELLRENAGHQAYVESIIDTLVRFKSPSFAPEKEVRWVYTTDGLRSDAGTQFRPHRLGLTPYREVPIDLSKVRSIIVGPKVPRQNLKTIEDFIILNDCGGFVTQSQVSLQ